jgi:methylenetetrahydrofolate dehydrogenase (NADP+)/methenyltetrahydrofolate cyclohydrolase
LLDGAATARIVRREISDRVAALIDRGGPTPCLAILFGGDDAGTLSYVRAICRSGERTRIRTTEVRIDETTGDVGLRDQILRLNDDRAVHGVILMLPLPAGLSLDAATDALDPRKDVDGVTPLNAGRLALNRPGFVPSTPLGGLELLRRHTIEVRGLNATVVGRSPIVGKPLAWLLTNASATVTVCHTATRDLAAACRSADLLCAAAGKPGLITAQMVKPGATVLDFGTSAGPGGTLVGDVDLATVRDVAGRMTTGPGGTGPMTTAMLLRNTLDAAVAQSGG